MEGNTNTNKTVKEFNISVPWGHIAVKCWGTEDDPHVLVFHGMRDNAGSFDNLIPFLSDSFYYICSDLPGHGRSSTFPPYLPIHTTDFLVAYKLIADHFKKEKYYILGHSYGAQLGLLFARMYPQHVEKLVGLELLPLDTVDADKSIKYLKERFEFNGKISQQTLETYTYEEALDIICKNRYFEETLTKQAGEPLLQRCIQMQDNGRYVFNTDPRTRAYFNPLHDAKYAIESLNQDPVQCPTLIIFSKLTDRPRKKYRKLIEKLQSNKNVTIVYVDGRHEIHNNKPKMVVPYINKFLTTQKSKI